jgi:hypothetical protein
MFTYLPVGSAKVDADADSFDLSRRRLAVASTAPQPGGCLCSLSSSWLRFMSSLLDLASNPRVAR